MNYRLCASSLTRFHKPAISWSSRELLNNLGMKICEGEGRKQNIKKKQDAPCWHSEILASRLVKSFLHLWSARSDFPALSATSTSDTREEKPESFTLDKKPSVVSSTESYFPGSPAASPGAWLTKEIGNFHMAYQINYGS